MGNPQSNQLTGGEAMVRMLQLHGVKHIFGLCGDTSLPLYDALYRIGRDITHVLTRDERSAAYVADAYARVTINPIVARRIGPWRAGRSCHGAPERRTQKIYALARSRPTSRTRRKS